ncbi:hypothetical protein KKH30_01275 [Candidatus Micrarchaeota archaeon]|nr:hypothetical protein [Candidatus Micrarchaeota archaeon]
MPAENIERLRAKFLRTFAKVSSSLRNEIVAVIGAETFDWRTANVEVIGKTKQGDEIVRCMDRLGLLG